MFFHYLSKKNVILIHNYHFELKNGYFGEITILSKGECEVLLKF